jgi:hypothetical protein
MMTTRPSRSMSGRSISAIVFPLIRFLDTTIRSRPPSAKACRRFDPCRYLIPKLCSSVFFASRGEVYRGRACS